MKKKLVVKIKAEIELKESWYDNPFSEMTDEQIIESEKDSIHEWLWDYIIEEDLKIINSED